MYCKLKDTLLVQEGKVLAKAKVQGCMDMPTEAELVVGSWELEVDGLLEESVFK